MIEKVRTIEHKEFGEVHLVRKSNIKRLTLKIKPFSGILMSVPHYLAFQQAENFLKEREDWIRRQLLQIREVEKKLTLFRQDTVFHTREHSLKIMETTESRGRLIISKGEVRVYYPDYEKVESERVQNLVRTALEETWRLEAKKYLPSRLSELAGKQGFQYNRILIRNNRSRWGSCSARNNINLNLHLMRLPDDLIDYVLIHELVHTRHKNHSRLFWELLEDCIPGARERNRRLRSYRTDIY